MNSAGFAFDFQVCKKNFKKGEITINIGAFANFVVFIGQHQFLS